MKQKWLLSLVLTALLAVASPAYAVYIADDTGGLYDLNVTTNTSTYLGNGGIVMFDIALDPITSALYGVSGSGNLYSINKTNGAVSYIGGTGVFINGLTFNSSGTLFGSGDTNLYTVNLGSGSASTVGSTGYNSSGDLAFDSLGNLYMSATSAASAYDQLVALNSGSGAGSAIGSIGFSEVYGLNFGGSTLYGFTNGGQTISIDTSTGAGTLVATNGIGTNGADGVGGVTPVPEPSSVALLGLGLLGLGFASRMKRS